RRFGPAAARRVFAGERGTRRRAWAERSLHQFGARIIIRCRFIPRGGAPITPTRRPGRAPRPPLARATPLPAGVLGELCLLHRPAGRQGLRGPAVGGAAARAGAHRRDQRADRGGTADLGLVPRPARAGPRCRGHRPAGTRPRRGAHRHAGSPASPGARSYTGAHPAAGRPWPRDRPGHAAHDGAKRLPMTGTPGWAWAAAVGVILGLLAVDLAMSRGRPTMRRAVLVSAGWVAAAVAFGGILLAWRGGAAGQEYFTAYLVEKALSID